MKKKAEQGSDMERALAECVLCGLTFHRLDETGELVAANPEGFTIHIYSPERHFGIAMRKHMPAEMVARLPSTQVVELALWYIGQQATVPTIAKMKIHGRHGFTW
jgi:hypothetical protein